MISRDWPDSLKTTTFPSAPTLITTALATVCPARTLRIRRVGRGTPAGHTVMNELAVGSAIVTLSTTALTAAAGNPARPATLIGRDSPGARMKFPEAWPSTVVPPAAEVGDPRRRDRLVGAAGREPADDVDDEVRRPGLVEQRHLAAAAETDDDEVGHGGVGRQVQVGGVRPAPPLGHTVTYDVAVGSVAVTLSATADAPAGTLPRPATWSVIAELAPAARRSRRRRRRWSIRRSWCRAAERDWSA